jgi:hypothetical protein
LGVTLAWKTMLSTERTTSLDYTKESQRIGKEPVGTPCDIGQQRTDGLLMLRAFEILIFAMSLQMLAAQTIQDTAI